MSSPFADAQLAAFVASAGPAVITPACATAADRVATDLRRRL